MTFLHSDTASWNITIVASRETPDTLLQTIQAAQVAGNGIATVDVLVNGNPALATAAASFLPQLALSGSAPKVRVWNLEQGDKANAWNSYLKCIWAGESITFFIDGYVRLNPDAVQLLGSAVAGNAHALGGTGAPSMGRTAAAMRAQLAAHSGLHGNFCCLKGTTIAALRQRGITLPFGLYRVDSLMGALLCFGLHPDTNGWDRSRIVVHPGASWCFDARQWWRPSDVKDQIKRVLRQARGVLENEAVKHMLSEKKMPAEQLPKTAPELVLGWVAQCPTEANALLQRSYLARKALANIRLAQGNQPNGQPPNLVTG